MLFYFLIIFVCKFIQFIPFKGINIYLLLFCTLFFFRIEVRLCLNSGL